MRTKFCLLTLGLAGLLFIGCSSQTTGNISTANANANAAKPAASAAASPVSSAADADEITDNLVRHEESGIQFLVPAGWKKEPNDSIATLRPPDGEVEVVFYIPEDTDYTQATKDVVDDLGKYVKNAKITEPGKSGRLNGLNTYSVGGTGERDGKPVAWDLTVVGGKKAVYVVSLGTPDTFAKHEAAYASLLKGIRELY
jgi:hypothetical protein